MFQMTHCFPLWHERFWHKTDGIANEILSRPCFEGTWFFCEIVQWVGGFTFKSWKDHCWSVLARRREVTLVPPLHCVITVGAAALWLFLTGCDTDGFDHRDSQSQGPRRVKGWGCCELTRERGKWVMVRTRSMCFARMVLKPGRESKQRWVTSVRETIVIWYIRGSWKESYTASLEPCG